MVLRVVLLPIHRSMADSFVQLWFPRLNGDAFVFWDGAPRSRPLSSAALATLSRSVVAITPPAVDQPIRGTAPIACG